MNNRCPEPSELLSLALGHLSERRSRTLEAHVASCTACQQEHAALVQLRSVVRERAPQMPAGLVERTWRRLPERGVPLQWRPLAIGTGTAALAGVLALTLLPGTPWQPTPAFAQVKQAMDKVDTATWNETIHFTAPNEREQKLVDRECWAQVSSARLVYQFKSPSRYVDKIIVDGERLWEISLKRRHWRMVDAWRAKRQLFPASSASDLVRQEILFPRDPAAWQERRNTALPSGYAAHSEQRSAWKMERDGELLRFRSKTTIPAPNQAEGTETVWVKPDTYRIVRRERISRIPIMSAKKPGMLISRVVCDNYRYDLPPPAEIFTIPVPEPGKPYVFTNMAQQQTTPSRKDKEIIRRTLDRAAVAWNRKDANAFLKHWDWKSYSLAEGVRSGRLPAAMAEETRREQNQWRTLVSGGAPFPRWEVETIGASVTGNGVYMRFSASAPFPPLTSPPNGIGINGTARVTDSQGQRWRVLLSAQFQRQPDGEFRLTSFALSPRRQARL